MRNVERLQHRIDSIKERMTIDEIGNDSYYISRDRRVALERIDEIRFEIMFKEKFPTELSRESESILRSLRWHSEMYGHYLKVKMCDRALAKVGA